MASILQGQRYGSSGVRQTSPTIPWIIVDGAGFLGNMATTYSEFNHTSPNKNLLGLQSSIMFAFGEWFDGVQAQISKPSIFKTLDTKDPKTNIGYGALSKRLTLITPFEKAFDHLDLPKKLLKQLIDKDTGLLAQSSNTSMQGGAELWLWNTPYVVASQIARGKGKSATDSDRTKILKYFYNQNKFFATPDALMTGKYSGPRPFRYFGYPQSTIVLATKVPASALSIATGDVTVNQDIENYKYSNNGSAPEWQTIADPTARITFNNKDGTPLWMIRSLSQYGNAAKVSNSMRVPNVPTPTGARKVQFPRVDMATDPDYDLVGFWAKGQKSPNEFKNIITGVADDPSPIMATQLGAAPQRGATPPPAAKGGKIPKHPVVTLTASKGAKPKPPKRVFSPEGVKVTISDFKQGDTFPMGKSWLVLNITPDQAIYNKVMKSWEAGQVGAMSGNRKFTPPKDYIKQYPKIVQLAFKAGTTLLINTNGKTKPEWKEYKWDRDKDVTTVNQNSTFTFIDEDPLKGISFHLRTNNMGSIVIKMTYDDAGNAVTTVDEWFKEGVTELKVEVGPGKGSMILPINVVTTSHSPDVIPMMLIDTNMALEWYQRSLLQYPVKETTADTYPDAWTVFGSEVEIDYFNADSLVQKNPLMFQAIPFDPSTATELDMTKEFLELTLFVKSNTDTYTGFDYSLQEYKDEKIVFPCDERFLSLESITTDPATGDVTKTLIQPSNVRRGNGIKAIWLSAQEDQVKIEFKSGETIIMPDEINRGFSAIEDSNQQQLTGLITRVESHPYPYGRATGPKELKDEMVSLRTVKNIPLPSLRRQSYEDSAGAELLAGTGGLIYEDEDKNVNVILPNPDPDKGLITFKLIWLREA